MSLADFSFIAAFVIFPLVIVALSVWALRTLGHRERQPLARFSSNNPAESTQEMPITEELEPRDRAASVRPTRGSASDETQEPDSETTHAFKVPTYRGRSAGVVRRIMFQGRSRAGSQQSSSTEDSGPR